MDKISIIIPVYNSEKYLEQCIKSVLVQTYDNWEVIIIDDGSKDNTAQIYNKFAKENNKIKIIYQKNQGVSAARNKGLEMANGEYITFLDADDWYEKDYLEKMINIIKKENADMVQCNFFYARDEKFEKRKHIKPEYDIRNNMEELQLDILYREYEEKLYNKSVGAIRGAWGKIFKSSILKDIRFNEKIDIFEDGIYILNVLQNVKKVVLIDEYLYYYRITNDSSNIKYKPDFNQKVLIIFEEINKFILKYNKDKTFERCFQVVVFEMMSSTIDKNIFNIYNMDSKKEKIKKMKDFLQNDFCKNAINKVNYKDLNKNQKLLYKLLKLKFYSIIYYLYNIKQKINIRKIIR